MAQSGQGQAGGVPGPAGRRLHIAHRRSPSELTPLMMEQLALQQQIEMLQQQQQQIAATHQQYVNMGMIPQQPLQGMPGYSPVQGQPNMANISPNQNFQFPQMQQGMGVQMNAPTQPASHRRNQSGFVDNNQQAMGQNRDTGAGRGRGGPPGGGHARRHSLALPEAKKAAELAEKKRTTAGFQFPVPGSEGATDSPSTMTPTDNVLSSSSPSAGGLGLQRAGNARVTGHGRSQSMAVGRGGAGAGRGGGNFQFPPPSDGQQTDSGIQRRGSQGGHARQGSRNFDGNWRQPQTQQQDQVQQPMGSFSQPQGLNPATSGFQPGHRARGSVNQSIGSISGFQYPGQPGMMQMPQGQMMMAPQMYAGQQLNALQMAQLQAIQNAGLQLPPGANPAMGLQQQQQQRKTLFTPYLPQATLPALLNDGQLVAGTLRVNKKNRSDAYVTTNDLDADIFICGSKDRNRALEGDLVAIELLDVDEVWGQKREKEEKKKRKDTTEMRHDRGSKSDNSAVETPSIAPDGSIRRRGSLRQRPTQKKNDDVEVEGQSLLLMEEEEISDDHKPLYAGHVVAVIERVAGQMFSGTLGLLRPSSQATKEKQEAERGARDGNAHGRTESRQQDKPKIVWFKPTDKRVPLIAIPTEQAPRDFVDKHQDYANRIFVACIKRWPITSLHPFGTLVEQLGEMGDLRVETDALLRDNNFASDEFSDAVTKSVGWEDWSLEKEDEASLGARRDLRGERVFTIDPTGSKELDDAIHIKQLDNGKVELGVHVTDVAHFIKANSLVDREAKKRGTGVYLMTRAVNMLPPKLTFDVCSLTPGQGRLTVSVIMTVDASTGKIEGEPWIGRTIIQSSGKVTYDDVDAIVKGAGTTELDKPTSDAVKTLHNVATKFRMARFGNRSTNIPPLRLIYQLDDENVPVEQNIFNSSAAHEILEEISCKANAFVAQKLFAAMPDKAFLRRQSPPNPRRLVTFAERMTKAGQEIDANSSGTLQNSLFKVSDVDLRKGMETLLVKTFQRAKYYIGSQVPEEARQHYTLNLPLYTHFTAPTRRYADIVVHRQLEAVLSDGAIEFTEDLENLAKTAEQCNNKKDSAQAAQEQSVHIESCRMMDKKSQEVGGDLISEGIVISVYESAFDVLIPEYGFEKRVHCDQLPLKKAEYRKDERVLELYWEKNIPSSAYVPEDERPRGAASTKAATDSESARQRAKERYEAQRKQTDTNTVSIQEAESLFDTDDELAEGVAGVSLNANGRPTQSVPGSPARNGLSEQSRTQSDSKIAKHSDLPESQLTDKQKYLKYFDLRETDGESIQDVRELTRVPVILAVDLTKSPPCLTIRSINPYAL
ncbi:Virulence protein SSD1 [Cyphellophora attinorum]|uniref:Virulence protein SSD1 n=1 Tax=Cyphellophora attinorum TaxID=1664694 RepID=A0A0N1HLI9_9EURO|nr:Virulence protein SSD1 [Phialophora attinorum]KPI35403.1 Virulence protein SSD1 [Phialophora attinorum]